MNKVDLTKEVADRLREAGVRKLVAIPKHIFHISDDEGNNCKFHVKRVDRRISFNKRDVSIIFDTCLDVIEDALRNGDEVNLYGFGVFSTNKRAHRRTKVPGSNDWVEIDEHIVPKFTSGKKLKMAVKLMDLSKGGEA